MHILLPIADAATIRRRAPAIVDKPNTYDKDTLTPAAGGLFDEDIFGPGASLDLPRKLIPGPRATTFGRIVLAEPVFHGHKELPVLPPDLRPIAFKDGEFVIADINLRYQAVINRNQRIVRLRELKAPPQVLLDEERAALSSAVNALVESLPKLFAPDRERAIAELDKNVGEGLELAGPLPMHLHRTVAVLFALGIEVVARSATA